MRQPQLDRRDRILRIPAGSRSSSDFTVRAFARAANSAIVTAIIFFIAVHGASKLDSTQARAATSGTWTNATTGGLWSDTNNWLGGTIADGIGASADFSTLDLSAEDTVHLDSARAVGQLSFGDATPSNNWVLDNNGASTNALTLATSAGSPTISVNNGIAATVSAVLTGVQGFTESGNGSLTLSAANTYTGGTTVASGNLIVGNQNALGTGGLTLAGGTTFRTTAFDGTTAAGAISNSIALSDGAVNIPLGSGVVTMPGGFKNVWLAGPINGGGGLVISGNVRRLTLAHDNTFSGEVTLGTGSYHLQISSAKALGTGPINVQKNTTADGGGLVALADLSTGAGIANPVSIGSGDYFDVNPSSANNVKFSGVISGAGSIDNVGTGTMTLTGANTYGGGTILSDGVLNVGSPENQGVSGPLGLGPIAFAGGTLQYSPVNQFDYSARFTPPAAPNSYSVDTNGQNVTWSANLSGRPVSKSGAGTLTLTGNNTFSGIAVNAGTLQLGNMNALQNSFLNMVGGATTTLSFAPGIGTFNVRAPSISGVSLNDTSGAPVTLQVQSGYAERLSGTGSLVKNGAGTLVLSESRLASIGNSFTGPTIINSGTIQIGAYGLENSTVNVNVDGGLSFLSDEGTGISGSEYIVGGLSGSGDISLMSVRLDVGSNNTDSVYAGSLSVGTLDKQGVSMLTLSGANLVNVIVERGTLNITGTLANNASASSYVRPGSDFSFASLVRRVASGGSYSGFGSTGTDFPRATFPYSTYFFAADIRAGINNNSSPISLAMQWRLPTSNDVPHLVSAILNVSGMSAPAGAHAETDPYALQMSYTPRGKVESALASKGLIDLVWLDAALNQPFGLWQNATAGNFGSGLPGDVFQNYQGSWDTFAAAHGVTDVNVGKFLGSYGVDPATHTVWAVVNFNGQFSVVPEPATLLLLGMGSAMLFGVLAMPKHGRRSAVLLAALPAALLSVVGVVPSLALAGTWIDTTSGGGWSNKNNWAGGAVPYGVDQVADFSTLDITSDNTVFLDSFSPLVGTLKFADVSPSNNWALATGGGYTFGLATTTGTPIVEVDNQSATITASLTGTQGFTKTGAGRLILPNAATLVLGPITVAAGVIELGKNSSGNTFAVNVDGGLAFGPSLSTCTLGGLTGSGNVSLSNASGGPVTLTVGGAEETYSGAFSGGGSLGWTGPGTLTLAGANAFNGDLAVGGGGLTLTNGNAPGSATLYHGTMTLTAAGSINAPVTVIGGTIQLNNANGLQNDTIDVNASNAISFGSGIGSFTIGGLTRTRSNGSITLTDTSGSPVTLRVGANNASTSFKGLIKGKGTLVKVGTGMLTMDLLNSASTFGALDIESGILSVTDGPTSVNQVTVNGGTLLFNGGGFGGPITVNADGGLAFGPSVNSAGLQQLSGTGSFSLTNALGSPVALTVANGPSATTYSGVLSGSGSLTITSPSGSLSPLILTGANTFTGNTIIGGFPGGALQIGSSNALQNSTVTLNYGAKLSFSPGIGNFAFGGLSQQPSNFAPSFSLNDTAGTPISLVVGGNNADSISDGLAGSGSLVKIGTGTLTLAGTTFSGGITVNSGTLQLEDDSPTFQQIANSTVTINANSVLKFKPVYRYTANQEYVVPGLAGSGSVSLVDTRGYPVVLLVGANNADTTYSGEMKGIALFGFTSSEIVKQGTGTLTLSGTYSCPEIYVNSGTLKVTGSLADNGSDAVYINASNKTATLVRRMSSGATYSGFGSDTLSYFVLGPGIGGTLVREVRSTADIRAGLNNADLPVDLAMQWRQFASSDVPRLASNVFSLNGMSASAGIHSQTDPFALQMKYAPFMLGGNEALVAADGLLNLVWLDTDFNQPNGLWVNATAGNFGTGLPGDVFQNYQGSWDTFAAGNGVTDANVGNFLGSYGVDPATHTVWAVVNFNGQFSVVPEPASLGLVLIGAACLIGRLGKAVPRASLGSNCNAMI